MKPLIAHALAALCLLAGTPAHGGPVLREEEITEDAVINALAPHGEGARVETQGLRIRDGSAAPEAGLLPAGTEAEDLPMLIVFSSNSSKLTPSARAALDRVARGLQSSRLAAYKFRVEGHADPRGPAPANLKLSESRAAAVVEYLMAGGVAAGRLTPVGKGSTEPMNVQNPAAPENRRVTILRVQP